jgi:hypothetical protein
MEGQRLSKNTIKGGASMGQAIDNLFIMRREPGVENTVEIELTDSRSKLSRLGKFHLQYNTSTCKFVEAEVIEEEQVG